MIIGKIGFCLNILSLLINIVLILVYYMYRNNKENRSVLYRNILFNNLFVELMFFISYISIRIDGVNEVNLLKLSNINFCDLITFLSCKFYALSIIYWLYYYVIYLIQLFTDSFIGDKTCVFAVFKKSKKITFVIFIISIILTMILPMHYKNYSAFGLFSIPSMVVYVLSFIYPFLILICYKKNISKELIKQIIFLGICFSLCIVVNYIIDGLYPFTTSITLVTMSLYLMNDNADTSKLQNFKSIDSNLQNKYIFNKKICDKLCCDIKTSNNYILNKSYLLKQNNSDFCSIYNKALSIHDTISNRIECDYTSNNLYNIKFDQYNIYETLKSVVNPIKSNLNCKNIEFTYNFSDKLPNSIIGNKIVLSEIIRNVLYGCISSFHTGKLTFNVLSQTEKIDSNFNFEFIIETNELNRKDYVFMKYLYDGFYNELNEFNSKVFFDFIKIKSLLSLLGSDLNIKYSDEHSINIFTLSFSITQKLFNIGDDIENEVKTVNNNLIETNIVNTDFRIAIVGTNKDSVDMLKDLINSYCYNNVNIFYDEKEFVNYLKLDNQVDLIIVDMMDKENFDGIHLMDIIKFLNINSKVLAITYNSYLNENEKLNNIGFNYSINKPFKYEDFKLMVDNIVSEK